MTQSRSLACRLSAVLERITHEFKERPPDLPAISKKREVSKKRLASLRGKQLCALLRDAIAPDPADVAVLATPVYGREEIRLTACLMAVDHRGEMVEMSRTITVPLPIRP